MLTSIPRITAFWTRNKVMWLVRLKGAVSQRPASTLSWPPPRLRISETALSKALVFTVMPSPTAPKSVRLKTSGRRRGMRRAGGPQKRSRAALCQAIMKTNPTVQMRASRVRWSERNGGIHWSRVRRESGLKELLRENRKEFIYIFALAKIRRRKQVTDPALASRNRFLLTSGSLS